MLGSHYSEALWRRKTEQEGAAVNLHNIAETAPDTGERPHGPQYDLDALDKTAVPSPESGSEDDDGGTWGERDVGGPVSRRMAMEDFEALRHGLSRTKSRADEDNGIFRPITTRSIARRPTQGSRRISSRATTTKTDDDLEAGDAGEVDENEEEFELDKFMREGHFEKRVEGRSAKKVGVIFKHLTVKGVGSTASFVRTLPDAVVGTFGPDLYRLFTRFIPALRFGSKGEKRTLINDFTGVVRDGELMLVLGRPGSGCSTFLKSIANDRDGFAEVTGDVSYGGIPAMKQKKMYRGEVNYNPEDDVHFPSLNVWQTLKFALMNKTKKGEKEVVPTIAEALMKMFGISHTKYTLVGNEYVRGISGGERKRVSIAEILATKSTVVCWDNSTRGLDASTALDYANSLRIMTDVSDRTTLVTLYQAGQGIYDLMDKVLVINAGKCVFQGRASDAKRYFTDLGYHCPERQTTADFLTACTDPVERRFREGYEDKTPKSPEEMEKTFRDSEYYQRVVQDVEDYEILLKDTNYEDAKLFEQAVQEAKSKRVSKKSSYTVSFPRQVMTCTVREFWLLLGDRTTLYTKFFIIISNGLIVGSLFYGQPLSTEGTFSRGGTLFFSILFLGWLQLTELMKAVTGRVVIQRHRNYGFYNPAAVSIARVIADFPILLVQVIIFSIIMYFMTNLDVSASKFFIYLLCVYTTTISATALYRMFASLSPTIDDAVRFSGIALNLLVFYTGYVIPKPQLVSKYIWFGWIYYLNPIAYSFEAVMSNEFTYRTMACSPAQLVPQGPGIGPPYQGCSLGGASIDATSVTGASFLDTTYNYTRAHLWRNFGVVIAFTVLYILITVIANELFSFANTGGGAMVFKRTKKAKEMVKEAAPVDEEKAGAANDSGPSDEHLEPQKTREDEALDQIVKSESVFTWTDVEYSVPYQGGQKKLLNKINGYAKPGVMVALVGASGAGKTTLLNTLSQRQTFGVISGEMLVDGRPLGPEFQRGTGFCEQMDLHDGTATIREALEFSAILRQDRNTPRQEKIEYVDTIIDLLELGDMQDAIVSSLGVEQRKRLTIGVELAAKPSLLLFLDEPTSGLDSQSAFSIVRFLKKLCAAGQAIICTIHQPSSILFEQFDMVLALNPGGSTFYFGPIGDRGQAIIQYFEDRGVTCPPEKNIAEFVLETAAKGVKGKGGKRIDWNEEWRSSEQNKELREEIERIKSERGQTPAPDNKQLHEYAAPVWTQTVMVTQRIFKQHWRDPSYYYGKLFVAVIIGIFNGFTFYKLGNSVQDFQNRMFTCFIILVIPPTVVNGVVPKFYQNMALWQARELPSRIYGWFAFCTAQVVGEIPIAVVSATIYWLLWYWPTGLPSASSVSGYTYLMSLLFFFFMNSWGQWICAFAPSFTVISNVLPFFFVMFSLFNGVVRPYSMIPVFWRYWMYYVNPSTYWIGGVLAATLPGINVACTSSETAHFNPPPGQTCASYAGAFANASPGYLVNPGATADCQYCPFSTGADYLSTLNIYPSNKWRDFGIFFAFVISNWALVYFFIYTVRIRGWSFGFGALFGVLGKGVDGAKKGLKKIMPGGEKE